MGGRAEEVTGVREQGGIMGIGVFGMRSVRAENFAVGEAGVLAYVCPKNDAAKLHC